MANLSARDWCYRNSSDVLTDLYEVDESLSGVDSEYDIEEFCLDFDFESSEMITDAESAIVHEETSQDTGAINDPLEINYADYNILPICVEQADEAAFTLNDSEILLGITKESPHWTLLNHILIAALSKTDTFGTLEKCPSCRESRKGIT
ncbi:hypothetical protein ACROYT_G004236 [Oculina patagonica]